MPPGPRVPRLFQMSHWIFRPIPFMRSCAASYGNAFTIRFNATPPMVFISEPAAIRQVFTGDPANLQAGRANRVLKPIVGSNSILMLDGARHKRERKLLMPPFHGERMRLYSQMMCEIVDRSIVSWPIGASFPIHPHMQEITLDIILRAVFGVAEGEQRWRLRLTMVEALGLAGRNPLLLVAAWNRLVRIRREIDRLLYAEIARRRAAAQSDASDIMTLLVAARDEEGRPMSDEEIRDEMVTMLVADHETTATSLAWTIHSLLRNPEALAAARAEVTHVIGEGQRLPAPSPEQIAALEYLDAVIKETARLNPVVPIVVRRLDKDTPIGDYNIKAGNIVAPCIYLTHRRPDLWPDPEVFNPDRFVGRRIDPFFPIRRGQPPLPWCGVRDLRDEDRAGSPVVACQPAIRRGSNGSGGAQGHHLCSLRRRTRDSLHELISNQADAAPVSAVTATGRLCLSNWGSRRNRFWVYLLEEGMCHR